MYSHCTYRLASEQLKALNGLDKVKKWVEDCGLKRVAVTNSPRANAELMITKLGLSGFFDAIIIGDECERAKPFPDPYLKAIEILNVSKDHTFVLEVGLISSFVKCIFHINSSIGISLII